MKSDCPFVVGSGYLTRGGRPALCIGMNPAGDSRNQVVFSVGVPGDSYVYATRIDGTLLRSALESVDDILPPEPKLVERWVATYTKCHVCRYLFASEELAHIGAPGAHSYHKIMVHE
jgi:hypothetical protein